VIVGGHVLGSSAKFLGDDSLTIVVDSLRLGAAKLSNVPAKIDPSGSVVVIGVGALSPMTLSIDYAKKRLLLNQWRNGPMVHSLPIFRDQGMLRVSGGAPPRWYSLAEFVTAPLPKGTTGLPVIDLKTWEIRLPY
jgi:hypothetical protein